MFQQFSGGGGGGGGGERKRGRYGGQQQDYDAYVPRRKVFGQRPVDYFSTMIHHVKTHHYRRTPALHHVPSHPYFSNQLLPVSETSFCPSTAIATQWVHTIFHPGAKSSYRFRVSFTSMQWAPNGRRLLCGTGTGEFLLYNGHSFSVENRTAAHEDNKACKALAWGPSTDLVVSGDDGGKIKVWLSNFVNTAEFDTNQKAIREIAWGPGEHKFVTAGQDGTAKVWDTDRVTSGGTIDVDTRLEGHGGDVHTVDWHPVRALILTGSQDRDARLWDPRSAVSHIATLPGHSQPVSSVRWHRNGTWFLTAGRDGCVKLWDIRQMKEVTSYEGHNKVASIAWHPTHDDLFASAGADDVIAMWIVEPGAGTKGSDGVLQVRKWTAAVTGAHDESKGVPNPINAIRWSPIGHLLASAAQEIKFWTRNKPGATEEIRGVDTSEAVMLVQ